MLAGAAPYWMIGRVPVTAPQRVSWPAERPIGAGRHPGSWRSAIDDLELSTDLIRGSLYSTPRTITIQKRI